MCSVQYWTQRQCIIKLRDIVPIWLFLLHWRYFIVWWTSDYHKDIDILQVLKKTTHFRELKLLNYTERMKALSNEPNLKCVQHQYSASNFCEALLHLLLLCQLCFLANVRTKEQTKTVTNNGMAFRRPHFNSKCSYQFPVLFRHYIILLWSCTVLIMVLSLRWEFFVTENIPYYVYISMTAMKLMLSDRESIYGLAIRTSRKSRLN